jgi:hypothetical protein
MLVTVRKRGGGNLGAEPVQFLAPYSLHPFQRLLVILRCTGGGKALHKAVKAALDEADLKKLPKVRELDAEYSELLTEKKARCPDYRKAKEEMQELLRAQKNIELFFDAEKNPEQTEHSR